jgi:hypothetical protein
MTQMTSVTPASLWAYLLKNASVRAETGLKARNLRECRELIRLRPPIGNLQETGRRQPKNKPSQVTACRR